MIVYQIVDANSILGDNPMIYCSISDHEIEADINNPDMPYERITGGAAE